MKQWQERMRPAQVAMLFRSSAPGVVAAMLAAIVIAALLTHLGVTPARRVVPWAAMVCICALCHLALKRRYDQASESSRTQRCRVWGASFSAICGIEGCLWGWSSVTLVGPDHFDLELLAGFVSFAMAAGAIPAFGSYIPAFWMLFLPATLPFMVRILSGGRFESLLIGGLAGLYVIGIAGLGMRSHAEIQNVLRLGFEKDELSENLRLQKDRAEEASLAKSRFLASASHDLRQPVHALSLFVGALRNVGMSTEARMIVDHVETSVAALDGLFTGLLNISQLDANIVPNRPATLQIQPLLERICREHAAEAADKGLVLRLHPCSPSVHADPALLERVLRNLVSNAVRHTASGRVVVGCRRGAALRVEVWDTGPGIPAALQDQVFEEFFQVGNPERDRTKGLGLGLAIVRRLAVIMDVTLSVRSIPGRGSLFAVTLPRAEAVFAPPAPRLPEPRPADGALILVVDDELAVRMAITVLLTGWGYQVLAAASGAEMLEHVAACPVRPVLLICDYRLRAGEDGLAVIRRLQDEYNDDLPALLITGDTAPERLLEAEASGLILLHKPVMDHALRAAITSLAVATSGSSMAEA